MGCGDHPIGDSAHRVMSMANQAHGATPATVALSKLGVPFTLHGYEHNPAETNFGLEASTALGIDPARVFNTLLTGVEGGRGAGSGDRSFAVAIVPVAGLLDLKALAAALDVKRAQMSAPALAERKTGYVIGGISPIGQRSLLRTVLDSSAQQHETILVSGGRRGLDLELAPADLVRATGAILAEIARGR